MVTHDISEPSACRIGFVLSKRLSSSVRIPFTDGENRTVELRKAELRNYFNKIWKELDVHAVNKRHNNDSPEHLAYLNKIKQKIAVAVDCHVASIPALWELLPA